MKLLHIDSSITGQESVSRQITALVVDRFRKVVPDLSVTYRDLAAEPVAHLAGVDLPHLGEAQPLEDFLAADVIVIGAPMYNFSIPSQLKAWIDRVLVAGKTFRYTERGPVGLAGDKRVVIVISRGGFYGAETPYSAAEHAETYLKATFGFIGVTDVEFIVAEGVQIDPTVREQALAKARETAAALRAA